MTEGRYSVVWTARETETAAILGLDDRAFLDRLQARFRPPAWRPRPPRRRLAYPLKLLLTRNPVRQRLVLIGNAAHTLHPVAGQGLNLGLRDLAALAQIVTDRVRIGADPGARGGPGGLPALAGRRPGPDGPGDGFSGPSLRQPWPPLRLGRDLGLLAMDLLPGARHGLAQRFMGTAGHLPRLARGLPL